MFTNSITRRTRVAVTAALAVCCAVSVTWAQARGGSMNVAMKVARHAYPTGDPATSVVMLERAMPAGVRVGEMFEYELKLTNLTARQVENVVLNEQLPDNFNVAGISPEPDNRAGTTMTWNIGMLAPRATKAIRFNGSARTVGEIPSCATVTFDTKLCSSTTIVQPELQLVKTAPEEVVQCDPIPLTFVVTNTGTGIARNVRITDQLPEGWTTSDGRREIVMQAGNLAAGQSRRFNAEVRSSRTGQFDNRASAIEDGGLTADAMASTRVVKPQLSLTKTGPDLRYLGRPAEFQLTVRNEGDTVARDVMLVDNLPAGTNFMQASDNGRVAGGGVRWNLGSLNPGESRTVSVMCGMTQIGTVRNTARATAYCAEAAAEYVMDVRGIPAILLEVVDIHDPIEVGANETYQIRVTNQGSADGTNIVISCMLPNEQQYISADGPTSHQADGQQITYGALPSLAPRAQATYTLTVKGLAPGDVRFKVTMTSDQLSSPVSETESTNLY